MTHMGYPAIHKGADWDKAKQRTLSPPPTTIIRLVENSISTMPMPPMSSTYKLENGEQLYTRKPVREPTARQLSRVVEVICGEGGGRGVEGR